MTRTRRLSRAAGRGGPRGTRTGRDNRPARGAWARLGRWRRGRPFWGGLLSVLAGAEICVIPLAPLEVMIHQGVAGIPSVLMGVLMIVMGLAAWLSPQHRALAGVVTVLLAMAALVLSNLGGFFLGTLAGIVGGSMCFAWQPRPHPAADDAADGAAAGEPAGRHHGDEALTA